MSDDTRTTAFHDDMLFVRDTVAPRARLPRRFAAPRWFGDATVAAARVRPPLWRLSWPACGWFLAGLRQRLVRAAPCTRH